MEIAIIALAGFLGLLFGWWVYGRMNKKAIEELKLPPRSEPPIIHTQQIDLTPLQSDIRALPNKILKSIQGSNNNGRGALGELIGYTQLKAEYDRIVPLGNIVDFMCIKFPEGDDAGKVDFVDIKTGKYARLNADQKKLQQLIKDKQVNFLQISVTMDETQPQSD